MRLLGKIIYIELGPKLRKCPWITIVLKHSSATVLSGPILNNEHQLQYRGEKHMAMLSSVYGYSIARII